MILARTYEYASFIDRNIRSTKIIHLSIKYIDKINIEIERMRGDNSSNLAIIGDQSGSIILGHHP